MFLFQILFDPPSSTSLLLRLLEGRIWHLEVILDLAYARSDITAWGHIRPSSHRSNIKILITWGSYTSDAEQKKKRSIFT